MKDKVDLEVQVAGPNAQRQIQQINAMVQAGAKAIIVYPISPTALNQVVKNACNKGVLIFAYDSMITEPCAYNTTIDQDEAGGKPAEWLVDKLSGKGNIVVITGVPGTSVDTLRTKAAKDVFAKYPGIHDRSPRPTACGARRWPAPSSRRSSPPIPGPRSTASGCRPAATRRPRCRTRPASPTRTRSPAPAKAPTATASRCCRSGPQGIEGANGTYRPMGYPSISYASPPYSGALALKNAVAKLDGKDVPKLATLPLPLYTNDQIKLCQEGTWKEMAAGCNVFQPQIISNPGWFASIYSPDTPEVGLQAALVGQPED